MQEDMSSEPVLKVWALDKLVKKTNTPSCLSTVSINNGRKQFPVSEALAIVPKGGLMIYADHVIHSC